HREEGRSDGIRRHQAAAGAGCREEREREKPQSYFLAGSSTCTTNSVPRTPMMAEGVRIFIDSGDCFTILPEIAARRPCRRLPSNSPTCVVVSKRYLSIANTLFGPTDTRLLSVKVMPAEPSAPVTITSASCRPEPTFAGSFAAPRWVCTAPLETLIRPISAAAAGPANARAAATIHVLRMTISLQRV